MDIYIAKAGQHTGPFSEAQLESMLKTGMIELTDSAWHDGLSDWLPLHNVLNISPPVPRPLQPPPIPVSPRSAYNTPSASAESAMFLYIPIERLVAMSIVSIGLYDLYWIYRNWRYLKERDGLKILPFLRGTFGYFFIYSLLKTIKTDPPTNRIIQARFSPGSLATGWIILTLIGNVLGSSPDGVVSIIATSISALSFCFLIPVQRHINALNEALPVRLAYYRWSTGHFVCLVFGIICWFLILIGLGFMLSSV